MRDRGVAVLVSSHLLFEIREICDRVGFMSAGRLVAEGPPASIERPSVRLCVAVDDRVRAGAVIDQLGNVAVQGDRGTGPGWLQVQLDGGSASELNSALVRAGIGVTEMRPEGDALEDAYLSLVDDDDVPR